MFGQSNAINPEYAQQNPNWHRTGQASAHQIVDMSARQANEPTMLGRTNELLNHIATLEMHFSRLRSDLWGEGDQAGTQPTPTTLEAMLANACTRVASLCGAAATIAERIGCGPQGCANNQPTGRMEYPR